MFDDAILLQDDGEVGRLEIGIENPGSVVAERPRSLDKVPLHIYSSGRGG